MNGFAYFNVKRRIRAEALTVTLTGIECEFAAYKRNNGRANTHHVFLNEAVLHRYDRFVEPGQYEFPFTLNLPLHLPSTLDTMVFKKKRFGVELIYTLEVSLRVEEGSYFVKSKGLSDKKVLRLTKMHSPPGTIPTVQDGPHQRKIAMMCLNRGFIDMAIRVPDPLLFINRGNLEFFVASSYWYPADTGTFPMGPEQVAGSISEASIELVEKVYTRMRKQSAAKRHVLFKSTLLIRPQRKGATPCPITDSRVIQAQNDFMRNEMLRALSDGEHYISEVANDGVQLARFRIDLAAIKYLITPSNSYTGRAYSIDHKLVVKVKVLDGSIIEMSCPIYFQSYATSGNIGTCSKYTHTKSKKQKAKPLLTNMHQNFANGRTNTCTAFFRGWSSGRTR